MRRIGGLLGRSPYGPLYEQVVKVASCVEEVPRLLKAMGRGEKALVSRLAKRIHKLEHEADDIKSGIRDHLSNSLFSSVERSEVLYLVGCVDSIADDAEKAAKLVTVRKTPVPKGLEEDFARLGALSQEAVSRLVEIAALMRDVTDGRVERSGASGLLKRIGSLGEFGFAVEETEIEFLRELFKREDEVGPVDLLILMRIVNQVAAIARAAENVADAMRRIVLNR